MTDLDGRPSSPEGFVPVAIELQPNGMAEFAAFAQSNQAWLRLVPVYAVRPGTRFCTAQVKLTELGKLPRELLKRVEVGMVAEPRSDTRSLMQRLGSGLATLLRVFMPAVPMERAALVGPLTLAVIDGGCAFANRQFRQPAGAIGSTPKVRVRYLWDQGSQLKPPPDDFAYGSQWTGEQLDQVMARHLESEEATQTTEQRSYAELGFETSASKAWHGTHVLDLLAGNVDPMTSAEDAASAADLIFVGLPDRALRDSSGRWLCVHVLDALRYIFDRAPKDKPLVVNLSIGAYAGSHDGSSLLEAAIDAMLLEERPTGTAVTVAAGNAYGLNLHAEAQLAPTGSAACKSSFTWSLRAGDATDNFLEIWFSRAVPMTVTVEIGNGGDLLTATQPGAWQLVESTPETIASGLMVWAPRVPLGGGSMILLALGPTTRAGRGASLPAADMVITIENRGADPVNVDAWIERDDPAWGEGVGGRQSMFTSTNVSREDTFSTLASGVQTVVVGASRRDDGNLTDFSSSGPSRGARRGPDLMAPGEESNGDARAHGIEAAALFSGSTVRRSGTSMSAPIVGRALANVFAASPGMTAKSALTHLNLVNQLSDVERTGGRRLVV